MVKKHASNLVEESVIDMEPAFFDIAQECLNDPHWTCTYLHTLSHALYVSECSFTDWAWGSCALCKTVQEGFDISFTNIAYTVTEQDGIMKAAYYETPVPASCTLGRDDPDYPVSFFLGSGVLLMTGVRNQRASCAHSSSSRLRRDI